ncbi:MAG: protein translocase subunit SecD [Pseudonocardiales bacterium]|nr:protein translocase subunit SecD [Pseudonocardiales bacterium]MBV9730151.1 protein translocase subunit SecD [Pseudonocardiales bacterium]
MAPPAGRFRPWRNLAIFAGIVAVLYSLVFFTGGGDPTPKLGIDLKGGTRVTLTARTVDGRPPSRESLDQARQIIEQRVNGIGVSGAEVMLDGVNLIITVPGENGEEARTLGQTAKLYFRTVISEEPARAPASVPGGQPRGGNAPAAPPASQQPPASGAAPRPVPPQPVQPQQLQPPPSGQPTPPPAPTPPPTPAAPPPSAPPPVGNAPAESADPQAAEQIRQARARLQSQDPAVQQQALAALNCAASNPLRGNDDPNLPLITCDQHHTAKYLLGPAFLSGEQISSASAGPNQEGTGYEVRLRFKRQGEDIWAKYTANNIGKQSAFALDGEVVSAPQIIAAIPPGQPTSITGSFTQAEAQNLANVLKYGSLPLSFQSSESETVSATLGLASLRAGLLAGALGLAVVFVYCLFYYRALGVLTILSLALSGLIVYAVLVLLGRWIGFTLDLAGVAGFIVAIGITADSFVIFFERLKDEVRDGRTFRSAVPRAWVRARRTILSADAVSFLAAAVLYVLAVGQVKGFAFTLGMSTVLDLVVVFLATHPLVAMASQSRLLSQPGLSGLGAAQRAGAESRSELVTAAGKGT